MIPKLLQIELKLEHDVVLARQRARQVAGLLGFDNQDQTRIATAVSELARNAVQYAGGGRVQFSVTSTPRWALFIEVLDSGPGIAELESILAGRYQSRTGMGLGILGVRRLMDACEIESAPALGTKVRLQKFLPKHAVAPTNETLARVTETLAAQRPTSALDEVQLQNQELLRTLDELRMQREQLVQVNRELEETNRGVVALYAELDERADFLQRANEIKTKFLSNMTHEFRTPLNSIASLSRMLLQRLDGELTPEQEKQVRYIQRSTEGLSELVNDLLDLAKAEAGKITVRPNEFRLVDLFGTLRGMLRPLLAQNGSVELVFDIPNSIPPLFTDESKVSQILRNFISNALKYTERGEVRVSAQLGQDETVVFQVADTGIGIADEDRERIFQEYSQVDHPLQQRVRGTGLGLPLARRLAALLGGSVGVRSALGQGSTFYAIVPMHYKGVTDPPLVPDVALVLDLTRMPVLVVEDNRESLFIYEKYLKGSKYQVVPARTLQQARAHLRTFRPVAVILDLLLESENTWGFLSELRKNEAYRDLPILVVTLLENEQRALALGADAFRVKPIEREWLLASLERLVEQKPVEKLLVIDDDEVSRYVLRGLVAETRFRLIEAANAREGLLLAREEQPVAIFLDLIMQGTDGFAVLDSLASDPRTQSIPVFIHTSMPLTETDLARLQHAAAVVPKEGRSREAQIAAVCSALVAAGLGPSVHQKEQP